VSILNLESVFWRAFRRLGRSIYVESERNWARAYLRHVGISGARKVASYTSERELIALFKLAKSAPERASALEIGSYLGASACYLGAGLAIPNGHLFCVDTWKNETMPNGERDTFAAFQTNTIKIRHLITPVRKNSSDLSESDVRSPLALVFIDGGHRYSEVKADFAKTAPWVAVDGIVAFHDVLYYEGVSRLVGEILSTAKWSFAGQCGNLLWIKRSDFPFR
jgi:predicted O-methyltransferase YrrM